MLKIDDTADRACRFLRVHLVSFFFPECDSVGKILSINTTTTETKQQHTRAIYDSFYLLLGVNFQFYLTNPN